MEATLPSEQGAEGHPVPPDQQDEQHSSGPSGPPHRCSRAVGHRRTRPSMPRAPSISARTSRSPASRIAGVPTKTTSAAPVTSGHSVRHASFNSLRPRFRSTAPPTRRPHTNPARRPSSPRRTYTTISRPGTRLPLNTARNSRPVRSVPGGVAGLGGAAVAPAGTTVSGSTAERCGLGAHMEPRPVTPTGEPGPSPGAWRGCAGPPGSASGAGIRGASCAAGCSVDTCASWRSALTVRRRSGHPPGSRVYRAAGSAAHRRPGSTLRPIGLDEKGRQYPPPALAHSDRPALYSASPRRWGPRPNPFPPKVEVFPQLWKSLVDK
jgi:hypothetical protein